MLKLFVFVAAYLAFVSQAAALSSPASWSLLRRQTSIDVPAGCELQCSSIQTTLSTCTDTSCLCKTSVIKNLVKCLDCGTGVQGGLAEAQALVDQTVSQCAAQGFNLDSVTVTPSTETGSASNSVLTTSQSGTGTLTASRTVTASATSLSALASFSVSSPITTYQATPTATPSSASHLFTNTNWSLLVGALGTALLLLSWL